MRIKTDIDFSKHELIIHQQDGLSVHHLKLPNTYFDSVKFINTNGILAVTGDYGNWIFCREFIPKSNDKAQEHYWMQKCKIDSTQTVTEFDTEGTINEINTLLGTQKWKKEDEEYLKSLLHVLIHGDEDYRTFSYAHATESFHDYEYIPYKVSPKYGFMAVMDAYDEICNRI